MTVYSNNFDFGTANAGMVAGSGGNTGGSNGTFFTSMTGTSGASTCTFSTTGYSNGSQGARIVTVVGETWKNYWTIGSAALGNARFGITFNSLPSAFHELLWLSTGTSPFAKVAITAANKFQLIDNAGGTTTFTNALTSSI